MATASFFTCDFLRHVTNANQARIVLFNYEISDNFDHESSPALLTVFVNLNTTNPSRTAHQSLTQPVLLLEPEGCSRISLISVKYSPFITA